MEKATDPVRPRTLVEAHEAVARSRPDRQSPLATRLAYYQHSATVYADIAEIDRGHHHESLYWADCERQRAQEIQAQIDGSSDE